MKTAVFANVALLAGAAAAAHLRLPFAYHRTAASSPDPGAEFTVVSLGYSVNVTIGTPPQEVSLLVSMDGDKTHVPDADLCGESPGLNVCPAGSSCEFSASLLAGDWCFRN